MFGQTQILQQGLALLQNSLQHIAKFADLFAEPSATDELELVELEQSKCSAAGLEAVAALVWENNWMVGRTKGLVGKCGITA